MGASESMLMDSSITMIPDDYTSKQSCSRAFTVQRKHVLSKPKLLKWHFYNMYGIHQVVLLHDSALGRREIMLDSVLLELQPSKLLDTGSTHNFNCNHQKLSVQITSHEHGNFTYALYIDGKSIVQYQKQFWAHCVYWKLDAASHCIVFPTTDNAFSTEFCVLVNNKPVDATPAFTNVDNCIAYEFTHAGKPYEFRHYRSIATGTNSLSSKRETTKYELRCNNVSLTATAPPVELSTISVTGPRLIPRKNSTCALECSSALNTLDKVTVKQLLQAVE